MFDKDKFIECVHNKPAIWDKKLPGYADRNERDRSWMSIGKVMFTDWEKIDVKEKDFRVRDMKKKWRHIRDSFLRFLHPDKRSSAARQQKKKYIYSDALTFLLNSMEKRPTSGNLSQSNQDNIEEEEEIVNEVHQETVQDTPRPVSSRKRKAKTKFSDFQNELLTQLDKSTQAEEDPDRLFILSLLDDYKKLNADFKLDFKLMTIQFFRGIKKQHKNHVAPTHTNQMPPLDTHPGPSHFIPLFTTQSWTRNFQISDPLQQFVPHQVPPNQSPHSSTVSPNDSVNSLNSDC